MTLHLRGRLGRGILAVIGLLAGAAAPLTGAKAYTHRVIYSFCHKTDCADGSAPSGGLTMDSTGSLFGTTSAGGKHGSGTVFKLTPNSKKKKWKLETLYSFCAKENCTDGKYPNGALVLDTDGNLYGTSYQGGASNAGLVFKLSPVDGKSKWKLTRLHDFASGGTDGYVPTGRLTYDGAQSGVAYDGISPLYGATTMGGGVGNGTVFSVAPEPGKAHWKEKILHAFATNEGALLYGGVIFDGHGNLYGAAYGGGSSGFGTVFELKSNASKKRWTVTVLHNFCEIRCTDGEDGQDPFEAIAMDGSGNLFGTTLLGGANEGGVAYKIVPKGENSPFTVLYNFCSVSPHCADGSEPGNGSSGPLAIDVTGNLFGTTRYGGNADFDGFGVVYKLTGKKQTVLYRFCAEANCADGAYSSSGLLLDGSNNLFGSTDSGGAYSEGTIYELMP